MKHLRVLIMCDGKVVDIHDLEDPRLRYIADFNQLNGSTPYEAVLDEAALDAAAWEKAPLDASQPPQMNRQSAMPYTTPAADWRQGCRSRDRRCRR